MLRHVFVDCIENGMDIRRALRIPGELKLPRRIDGCQDDRRKYRNDADDDKYLDKCKTFVFHR